MDDHNFKFTGYGVIMDKPKVISIGFAVPMNSYTQKEVFSSLGYPSRWWSIFNGADIEKRHFWKPMWEVTSWQEAVEGYKEGAIWLSKKVIELCLDDRTPSICGSISFASCTGYECPSIIHRLASEMGFASDAVYTSILGHGCEGGFPALRRAFDYSEAHSKPSLAVSCEICSVCHFPENGSDPDKARDYELLRANAIFGDGASSVLVGFDDEWRHPYIIGFESYFDPDNMEHLGFLWQDGRLRCLLSRQVPKIAPLGAKIVVDKILQRYNLEVDDISWWVIHPGGKTVLDNIRDVIGLPEEKLSMSREALRLYGNCSSSSIGIVGKLLMSEDIHPHDYIMVVSLGAGLAAGATLLRFGE